MADGTRGRPVIETKPGLGLLSAEAYWASVVGPQRLAMAARKPVPLNNTAGTEIYKVLGASNGYVLVGVALPFNFPNPLQVAFGTDEQLGFNTGWPFTLIGNQNAHIFQFTQLLLPGEQLFAQIMDPAVPKQNVVVAAAIF